LPEGKKFISKKSRTGQQQGSHRDDQDHRDELTLNRYILENH